MSRYGNLQFPNIICINAFSKFAYNRIDWLENSSRSSILMTKLFLFIRTCLFALLIANLTERKETLCFHALFDLI